MMALAGVEQAARVYETDALLIHFARKTLDKNGTKRL